MSEKPILTSMKSSRIDRPEEDSSLPMLREMITDALRGFQNYEKQKGGVAISTQCARATINGKPVIGVVVVAIYPTEKIKEALPEAVNQTIDRLP